MDSECGIFRVLFLYEHKHMERFSNLHWCTFRIYKDICYFRNDKCSSENYPLDFLHFQVFITILNIHSFLPNLLLDFFTIKPEHFCSFLYVLILVLNFSKPLGCCQTLFAIYATSLLIFYQVCSFLLSS